MQRSAVSRNTRQRILRHSMAEFATKGYDGARVDSIAHRCRLSKNLLYHYFKSKEGLFIAVLEDAYKTFRSRQSDFAIRDSNPIDAMRQLIAYTFDALLENQDFIALLNTANLHKGRHLRRSPLIRSLYDPLVDTVREILRRGAAEGVFRPNIDPVNLYLSRYLARPCHRFDLDLLQGQGATPLSRRSSLGPCSGKRSSGDLSAHDVCRWAVRRLNSSSSA
jgi:TetR/AcrR family transcriptional regulator